MIHLNGVPISVLCTYNNSNIICDHHLLFVPRSIKGIRKVLDISMQNTYRVWFVSWRVSAHPTGLLSAALHFHIRGIICCAERNEKGK
jgi:hypothetical protein